MLKRKVIDKLNEWKNTKNNKCLIVSGARQVGKTYAIRQFGKEYYQSLIELNFMENPSLIDLFEDNLSAENIIRGIKLYVPECNFVDGNTLLFLDEIQDCPKAITALKFLAMESRIDVIASGSLLGMSYNRGTAYPVGYVDYIDMYALDFEEFLWAKKIDNDVINYLRECFDSKQAVMFAINEKMMQYLREYMVVGGMPEVVATFIEQNDFRAADKVQRRIYRDYIADIARFSEPSIKIKAEKCYKSIPLQLSKDNHKFQYSVVEHKGTSAKFESSIDWILNAGMAIALPNVSRIDYPLETYAMTDNIRMYTSDIGLLISTYDYGLKQAIMSDKSLSDNAVSSIILSTAKGGLYEALVADMLLKADHKDMFFYRNEQGTVEMEFLIQSGDGIIPIEVKAGRTRTKSLDKLLEKDSVPYGYKLASQNIGVAGKKITLPLYMTMFL